MPAFYPNSYGTRAPHRLCEYNPCHEPGGKPSGGQFAAKGSNGCTSTGDGSSQKTLFSPAEMKKYAVRSTGDPRNKLVDEEELARLRGPRGIRKEKPESKALPGSAGETPDKPLDGYWQEGDDTDVDEALQALGVRMGGEDLATAMVSHIKGETFSVTATAKGKEVENSYDGPDPDDVRSEYDDWSMEQVSEAESDLWGDDRKTYVRESGKAAEKVAGYLNAALGDRASETHGQSARDHTEALVEAIFKDGEILTTEGYLERGAQKQVQRAVAVYLEENPDATFQTVPTDPTGEQWTGLLDRDKRLEWSKHFNDEDGQSNWTDDAMGDGRIDVDDFDTWYERNYGHSPSKYGEYSGGGDFDLDNTKVAFQFTGSEGTSITRTFSLRDGELHVHHDYFTTEATGDGVAKQLFQGSLRAYDAIGVKHLSTLANIDVGAYAWARFGFTAENPYRFANDAEKRAKKFFRDTGLLDDADWERFTSLMDENEATSVWDVADAKYYTTPDKARSLVGHWEKRASPVFNKKLHEDAEKGIVSIGRITMVDMAWDAFLDLHDEASVKRLESYVGPWRRGTTTPSTPRVNVNSPEYRAKIQRLDKKLARARAETSQSGGAGTKQSRALVKPKKSSEPRPRYQMKWNEARGKWENLKVKR